MNKDNVENATLGELVERDAFDAFVYLTRPRALSYACKQLNDNRDDAENLVQDVYIISTRGAPASQKQKP